MVRDYQDITSRSVCRSVGLSTCPLAAGSSCRIVNAHMCLCLSVCVCVDLLWLCVCLFVCFCLFVLVCICHHLDGSINTRKEIRRNTRNRRAHTQRHTITSDIAAAIRSIPIPAVRVGTCRADMLAMAPEMAIEVSRGRIVLMLLHMRVSENWGCLMLGSLY